MKPFLWNIFLAVSWALAVGQLSLVNLTIGFVLGYIVLWLAQFAMGESDYYQRVWKVFSFILFYLWQLVLANLRVAYDVLTPTYYMRPGIIAIPLDAKTPEEITLLSSLITLTPGTLTLDISEDHKTLYLHEMFIDDPDKVRARVKEGLEGRVLELLR